MKTKSKRKSGIGNKVVIAVVAMFFAVCVIGLHGFSRQDEPFSLIGIYACGQPVGVDVTLRSGKHVYYPAGSEGIAKVIEQVPDERRQLLKAVGPYCFPTQPKTY